MYACPLLACSHVQLAPGVSPGRYVAQHQPLGAGGAAVGCAQPPRAAARQLPGCCQLLLLRRLLRVLCEVGGATPAGQALYICSTLWLVRLRDLDCANAQIMAARMLCMWLPIGN
jgi:hypothetical protein